MNPSRNDWIFIIVIFACFGVMGWVAYDMGWHQGWKERHKESVEDDNIWRDAYDRIRRKLEQQPLD